MRRDERGPSEGPEWAVNLEVVFLARHGETEWNRLGRRQGQLDSPLTADGLRVSRDVVRALAGLGIDGVFTSPLGRAVATARSCAEALGRPVAALR